MAANPGQSKLCDRKDILPIVLFLAAFLGMFHEFFFTDTTFFDRDLTLREIPSRKLCAKLLREGHLALWTDAYGGGQPFLANPKNAVLYPATLLYLIFPLFAAFKIYYLMHVLLTWTGLYFLGRSYSLSRRASFLSASLFVLGGMYLSSFEFYNHVAALAWLPWILIFLLRPVVRWIPRLTVLAALWTLSILAGAPEITLITLLLGTIQILFLVRDRWRRLALGAASFVVALLLSAAQLVPSVELWKQGPREAAPSADWPLEIIQILNVPFADVLGNDRAPGHDDFWSADFFSRSYPLYYSLYTGIVALALAAWTLGSQRRGRTAFLAAAAVFFIILAGGWHSPFYRLLQAVPLLSSIRYPVKFFLGSVFAVCFLAGLGFDGLFSNSQVSPKRELYFIGGLAGFGVLLLAFSPYLADSLSRSFSASSAATTDIRVSLRSCAGLALLVAVAVFLAALSRSARGSFLLLLIVIAVFDLGYHNRYINPVLSVSFYSRPSPLGTDDLRVRLFRENDVPSHLNRGKVNIVRLDRYAREGLHPLTGIGDGLDYLFDEDHLDIYPRTYRYLWKAIQRLTREDRVKILKTEACPYYASHSRLPDLPALEMNTTEGVLYVHKLADPPIQVRLVHGQIVAASLDDKLRVCLGQEFDPEREVIVDQPLVVGKVPPGGEHEAVEILERRQGFIRARAALSADGIIVVPGNFARGWKARIDGRPANVFPANLSSKGIRVPSGRHLVELVYSPSSFWIGALISALSALSLAALALISWLAKRRGVKRDCLAASVFL